METKINNLALTISEPPEKCTTMVTNEELLSPQTTKKSIPDRGQWSGPFDFIMSMIAYTVGLGTSILIFIFLH